MIFWSNILYTIADADTESLKSLHTLFDKYLDHMQVKFEQSLMVQTDKSVDAILEDVPVTKISVWC